MEAYLVDDDVLIRKLVHSYFREKGVRIWPYSNATDFLIDLDQLKPAPVILDYRLPDMTGIELMKSIRKRGKWWPAAMITAHADVPTAVRAFQCGVSELLQKPFGFKKLSDVVLQFWLDVEKSAHHYEEIEEIKSFADSLTHREQAVAKYIIIGNSNKEISLELGISPRTVEIYRSRVFRKMEVRGVAELVRKFLLVEGIAEPSCRQCKVDKDTRVGSPRK